MASARAGLFLVLLTVGAGLLAPLISPFAPREMNRRLGPAPPLRLDERGPDPTKRHWLGTDGSGRDILARVLAGARVSLLVGVTVSLAAGAIGVALGAAAGFWGGWIDALAMRLADIVLAFPRLILAIGLLAVAPKPSLLLVMLVLSATGWAGVARLTRAEVIRVKALEFALAARSLGASDLRLLWRHVLPSVWGVVATWMALAIPGAVMAEAGLSFLGLGVEPGVPSWGAMISEASNYDIAEYWWIPFFPGLALALSVAGWNLAGEALQEALNPRLRTDR